MKTCRTSLKLAPLAALLAASSAMATDGYFSHGYGMKAKGMGGVATALAQDSFGGANNPASMVWAGERLDIGVDLFSPPLGSSTAYRTRTDSTSCNLMIQLVYK